MNKMKIWSLGWSMFRIDEFFSNLQQSNGDYRIGIRILCTDECKTGDLMDFCKNIVGPAYEGRVKSIRCIDNNPEVYCYDNVNLELMATVDCFFYADEKEEAYRFVNILRNLNTYLGKSFDEVGAILDRMISDTEEVIDNG